MFELTSVNGTCVNTKELHDLRSSQEETDTRVVLYAIYGASQGYESIKVRSPDSDIFFILLHHASKILVDLLFDTGFGNSRRLINVSELARSLGEQQSSALMVLHVLTGCDTTSAFKGKGKLTPIKVIQKSDEFQKSLVKVGETWDVDDSVTRSIEKLTCVLYGNKKLACVNKLRLQLLQKKCNNEDKLDPTKSVDLSSLPPCLSSLTQHIKRTNYQVAIWKKADENFPEIPSPEDHGWVFNNDILEPHWCEGEIIPEELIDIMENNEESDTDEVIQDIESDATDESDCDLLF